MRPSATILFCSCLCLTLVAGCGSTKDTTNAMNATSNAMDSTSNAMNSADRLAETISTLVRPQPVREQRQANPVDVSHSKVIFTNATDRVLSITLEGPRTYDINVGYGGDVDLVVVPGTYTSRYTAPSTKTGGDRYTFNGGVTYEYHFFKPGHEPR